MTANPDGADVVAHAPSSGASSAGRMTVAARGIIRHEGRLLLVTDGNGYWYAPGGRMELDESLPACLVREVHEETGLRVQVGDVLAVSEFLDTGEHKIECFFAATVLDAPAVLAPWQDTGGPVERFGLFSDAELAGMDVRPGFLVTALPDPGGRSMPVYVPASSSVTTLAAPVPPTDHPTVTQ